MMLSEPLASHSCSLHLKKLLLELEGIRMNLGLLEHLLFLMFPRFQ